MDPETRGRVDRLLETYSVYYDVETCEEGDLVAKACFHSRGEKYLLTGASTSGPLRTTSTSSSKKNNQPDSA